MDIFQEYPDLQDPEFVESFDFAGCPTANDPDAPMAEFEVAVALVASKGNISEVSRLLKRSRRSVEGFVTRNMKLQMLNEDLEAEFLDDLEFSHKLSALAGDPKARQFFLTTKGKNRGYSTRSEVTGKDGKPLEPASFDPSKMSDEALRELMENMENGSGSSDTD